MLGLHADPRRAAKARDPGARNNDQVDRAALRLGAGAAAGWAFVERVSARAGAADGGVRFLHGGDRAAPDDVCAVLGRARVAAVRLAGVTANPEGAWVTQQARNLAIEERLGSVRYLIHDRDAKFCGPFDAILRSEGVRVIELDQLLIFGRRHLEQVLRGYVTHYNAERPHRALGLAAPAGDPPEARGSPPADIRRRDVVGGVIHEYYAAAA